MATSYVCIPGFDFFRGDVFGEVAKHGVRVYVSEKLKPVQLKVDIPNLVVLDFGHLELFIIGCYRPPSYSPEENARLINFILEFPREKSVVLLGTSTCLLSLGTMRDLLTEVCLMAMKLS